MTNTATEALSVVVEREIPYPPEKIWRALTQPHLIEEWLMKNLWGIRQRDLATFRLKKIRASSLLALPSHGLDLDNVHCAKCRRCGARR